MGECRQGVCASCEALEELRRYALLPQEFKNADVQKVLDISSGGASMQIDRWVTSGFVEKLSKNHYKKIVDFIIM